MSDTARALIATLVVFVAFLATFTALMVLDPDVNSASLLLVAVLGIYGAVTVIRIIFGARANRQ